MGLDIFFGIRKKSVFKRIGELANIVVGTFMRVAFGGRLWYGR